MTSSIDLSNYDIAIIGLGPVGATLANILGQHEISTVVIEQDAAPHHLPRAVAFDDEVMRIFQSINLAQPINDIVDVGEGVDFVDEDGEVLVKRDRPKVISPNGRYINYRFHQPELEAILREGLLRFPSVQTLLHREVLDLIEDIDGVCVEFKDLKTGKKGKIRSNFVIGCDGARSFTREKIGKGFEDLGFNEPWLVVDLVLKNPRPDLGPKSVHHCAPDRSATYDFLGGHRRRWELRLKPDDDPGEITNPKHVWSMLSKWIGPDDAILERAIVYTFHSSVAKQWRRDRLMIAGDAAHQTPPFMGQGMCAGIRDVFNLGWKLNSILKGRVNEDFLRTYQSEREPHVRAFIDLTVEMGRLINTTASSLVSGTFSNTIGEPQKLTQLRPTLGPGLSSCNTEWAGHLFPQPKLISGELLDDLIGRRWAILIRRNFSSKIPDDIIKKIESAGLVMINDPSSSLQNWLSDKDVNAVLIRPDRYIVGSAKSINELQELITIAF